MLEAGYLRIPGSRPHKISPRKEKKNKREDSWDNRFHLGKIPEYNAAVDVYLQRFQPIKKKKIIIGVGRVRKYKEISYKDLLKCTSSSLIPKKHVVKSHIIKKLKENLVILWEQKGIPYDQREVILKAIEKMPAKKQSTVLVKEMDLYKHDRNPTQLVLRAIKARENSLIELKDFADTIANPTSIIKQNSVESLINLRMLSLHVVECIQAWRKNLHELDPETIPDNIKFIWGGKNYLMKMFSDSDFLKNSQMTHFIEYSTNDPFFVYSSQQAGKIELPLPNYLLKRIKESEKILENEGLVLREIKEILKVEEGLKVSKSKVLENIGNEEIVFQASGPNVEREILDYSTDVPLFIQNSMGKCSIAYSTALSMRFPAFLWVKIKNLNVGLISLNLDNQKSVQNRILISHISALNLEIFEKMTEAIIKYLWSSYSCNEIRVGIIAKVNDLGKYECESSIKNIFDKQGFRWKQMIYAINEIPVQILGLRRVETPPTNSDFSIFSDCLIISYACGIQRSENLPNVPQNFLSAVGIACAYRPYNSTEFGLISKVLTKLTGIPPAFRYRKDSTLFSACRDLHSLPISFSNLNPSKETSVSYSSLGLSWEKFLPVIYNAKKMTKILTQVNIMKSSNEIIYVLPTEDPSYNVFIIPNDGAKVLEGFEGTQELLRNMEKVGVVGDIYIPDFEIDRVVRGTDIEERIKFKVATAMHPMGGYLENPVKESVVIGTRFIFGVVHQKLDEDLELPLYVFEVFPENIIKIS